MAICPYCSHNLLNHLRSSDRYWYCCHCRVETSNSFVTAKNKATLRKSALSSCDRPAYPLSDRSFVCSI